MKNSRWYYSIWFKIFLVFVMFLSVSSLVLFFLFSVRFKKVYRQQAVCYMEDMESLATENVSDLLKQIDQLSVSVLVDQSVQNNLSYINTETKRDPAEDDASRFYKQKDAISSQLRGRVFNVDGVVSLRIYSLSGTEIFIGTTNREYLEYSLTPAEIYRANGAALWEMTGEKHSLQNCCGPVSKMMI